MTINWDKPVEYDVAGNWKKARLICQDFNHLFNYRFLLAVDVGDREVTRFCDSSGRVSSGVIRVRNVQEKKKFWTVTYFDPARGTTHASTYLSDPLRVVGFTYTGHKCINVVEGEYSV